MADWETIGCQNPEPHEHVTFDVEVDLSERHGYLNFAPIPERLWVEPFKMEAWDWTKAAEASVPLEHVWCPMRCAISQTIAEHGIWEPPETLALLNLFEAARLSGERWTFIDVGAQIGWFSILALKSGLHVLPIEGDPEVAKICLRNMIRHAPKDDNPGVLVRRIGPRSRPILNTTPSIVKIDIEGSEEDALRVLWSNFEQGKVKAALIELTPHFGVDVEGIADQMINDFGMGAILLPHILDTEFTEFDQLGGLEQTDDPGYILERAKAGNQINTLFVAPDVPLFV
jgi:hypothetical protein